MVRVPVFSPTNASGTLLWREDYTPFGEARQQPAANDNDEAYTGHIADSDTGIVYMQARYYDPAIGRFLSNDPVGFADEGWLYFNRFAYVANDPIGNYDPTGEELAVVGDDQFFAAVVAMIETIEQTEEGAQAIQAIADSDLLVQIVQPGHSAEADRVLSQQNLVPNMTGGHPGSTQVNGANGPGGGSIIAFDAYGTTGPRDDTGSSSRPPVVGLAHEIGHAYENLEGAQPPRTGYVSRLNSTPPYETRALALENAVRNHLGLPSRTYYFQ